MLRVFLILLLLASSTAMLWKCTILGDFVAESLLAAILNSEERTVSPAMHVDYPNFSASFTLLMVVWVTCLFVKRKNTLGKAWRFAGIGSGVVLAIGWCFLRSGIAGLIQQISYIGGRGIGNVDAFSDAVSGESTLIFAGMAIFALGIIASAVAILFGTRPSPRSISIVLPTIVSACFSIAASLFILNTKNITTLHETVWKGVVARPDLLGREISQALFYESTAAWTILLAALALILTFVNWPRASEEISPRP